jgi:integrase
VGKEASEAQAALDRHVHHLKGLALGIGVRQESRDPKRLLDEACGEYLDLYRPSTGKKVKTYQAYRMALEHFRESCPKRYLEEIDRRDLQHFTAFLIGKKHHDPRTAHNKLAVVAQLLNYAIRLGYIKDNPVSGVKLLAEPQDRMHVLSQDEERKYLQAASRTLRDVGVLILGTGMRPAEVLSLKSEDIHLAERYAFVPKGKTRAARRSLPLTENALRVLSRRVRGEWCFPSHRSETGHVVNLQKLHQQACRRAGLKFRLYDLRHTYGSRAAMAGVDLPTLKELMGHESISTTMQYVHPTPEHKLRAVLRLETYNAEERKLAAGRRVVGAYNSRRAIASLKKLLRAKY